MKASFERPGPSFPARACPSRGYWPRLFWVEHGLHRWHGGQRRAAGAAKKPQRDCSRRAVGGRILRAFFRRIAFGRRIDGRPLRPAARLLLRRRSLRAGVDRLRPGAKHRSTDHRARDSGRRRALLVPGSLAIIFADNSANAESSAATFTLRATISTIYHWSRGCTICPRPGEKAVTLRIEKLPRAQDGHPSELGASR
jgi:hypothetical protein